MLVQPTISHFVKNLSKTQPLLKSKQETTATGVVNSDPSCEDHAALTCDLSCDKKCSQLQVSCENKLSGGSNNPFAIKSVVERQSPSSDATPNEEGHPLNQVKPQRGGHKLLSLKDRKRKHRTLSISPQSAERCSKKVCSGTVKNENIHPNPTDCQIPNGDNLEKVEDSEKIHARKLSHEFTMEEAALMCGYALDSEQPRTKKLSLADLDMNAKPSSSVSLGTPSKDHLLSKMNRSTLSSIPCSPSFSPRKPTPKAFSPFFERTRATLSAGKEDYLVNGHVQASESIENLESSAVLFSTPATESSQGASQSMSKSVPRRTLMFDAPDKQVPIHSASPVYRVNETILPSTAHLLPSTSALPPAETLHQSTASNDDFSFISDISLSEFADVSRIEMEPEASTVKTSKKFALNRHLVLEVTSQECSSEDAVLCTGR